MTDFTTWLRPTLLGPFVTTWGFATLGQLIAGALVLPNGERLDSWLVAMLSVSFFAAAVVVGLLSADLILLRWKLRSLPTGARAWTSSLLAPAAVWVTYSMLSWDDVESIAQLVAMIGAPILAAPLALRWAFGQRP